VPLQALGSRRPVAGHHEPGTQRLRLALEVLVRLYHSVANVCATGTVTGSASLSQPECWNVPVLSGTLPALWLRLNLRVRMPQCHWQRASLQGRADKLQLNCQPAAAMSLPLEVSASGTQGVITDRDAGGEAASQEQGAPKGQSRGPLCCACWQPTSGTVAA